MPSVSVHSAASPAAAEAPPPPAPDARSVTLVLHNIRSTYNVGAILRSAEGFGASRVIYSGYTPRFADPRLLPHLRAKLDRAISKVSLGAERLVPQSSVDDLPAFLTSERERGALLLGLENNLSPAELPHQILLSPSVPVPNHQKIILLLGEEVAGIPPELRPLMDFFLEIPMRGRKESFNVSVAASLALWKLTS